MTDPIKVMAIKSGMMTQMATKNHEVLELQAIRHDLV